MKRITIVSIGICLLASCNRVNPKHDFFISGVLIDNCQDNNPMGGVEVQFDVNGETFASATTNGFGEFTLSGTAKEKNGGHGNIPYLAINYTAQNGGGFHYKKLAILPIEGAVLDTLYYNGTGLVEIQIKSQLNFSENDTLYMRYSIPYNGDPTKNYTSSYGDEYRLKFAGPFAGGVLDTVLMAGHPHHKYHNDRGLKVTFWVNDYQDWRAGNENFRASYSKSHLTETPGINCGDITPLEIELK